MLSHRIFVYGTLKQGFRNFHINRGTRLPGEFITEQAFPLYVGQAHRFTGQVLEVDECSQSPVSARLS